MIAALACLFFGVVLGAAGHASVRRYYWYRAIKPYPMRVRYRRHYVSQHSRVLNKNRRYYPSRYRLSRLLDRLETTYDDRDLVPSDLRR